MGQYHEILTFFIKTRLWNHFMISTGTLGELRFLFQNSLEFENSKMLSAVWDTTPELVFFHLGYVRAFKVDLKRIIE